jgi:Tfp pilus assembly protein PilF
VNPYFLGDREITEARPFTHRDFDIFLVSRLDGYTVNDALALIERGSSARGDGKIVLDQRGALVNRTGESWIDFAAQRLTAQGHGDLLVHETTPKPARGVADVLGYFSWGSTDPQNRVRGSGMRFVPGAIAASFVGSDARTFDEPPATWVPTGDLANRATWHQGSAESLIGDLIREGVTGVAGYVSQPFLSGTVRPQILFPAYVAGFNLIEAFYLATPHLSWQTIVVGDPLATAFPRKALTPSDIAGDLDPNTGLPGFFSTRRLETATSLSPGIPERAVALLLRAEGLSLRRDSAAARSAVEESVALAPRFVPGLLLLANLDEAAGRRDQAISTYRRILDVEPDHVIALNNLAYGLAVHLKMPKDALPYAERAVARANGNPTILDTLAWVHHLLGDDARAASVMEAVVRSNVLNADIRLHAAIVFAAVGSRASAQRELALALKLDPALATSTEVKELSARLSR